MDFKKKRANRKKQQSTNLLVSGASATESSLFFSARDIMKDEESSDSKSNASSQFTSLQDRIQQERDRVNSKRDRIRSNRQLAEAESPASPVPAKADSYEKESNILSDDSLAYISTHSRFHENEDGWIEATGTPTTKGEGFEMSKENGSQKVIPLSTRSRHVKDSVDGGCWQRFKWIFIFIGLLCLAGGIAAAVILSQKSGDDGKNDSTTNGSTDSQIPPEVGSCEAQTNIFSDCTCRDELPFKLANDVAFNRDLILTFLTENGALEELDNTTSPTSCSVHNQALVWVSDLNNHATTPPTNLQLLQRYALAVIYQSLGGNSWTNDENTLNDWLNPFTLECDWHGVVCSEPSERIVSLDLSNSNLYGTLPNHELGLLESLRDIDFSDNPNVVGQLTSHITALPLLQTLHLSRTSVSGVLPTEWGRRVTELGLSGMKLTGPLPATLTAEFMRTLDASDNALTGTIPFTEWSNMMYLEELDVSSNQLQGTLPAQWDKALLETFFVNDNVDISGSFPEPYSPFMSFVHFDGTALTGLVPGAYCDALLYLDSIVVECGDGVDIASCACCQCSSGSS